MKNRFTIFLLLFLCLGATNTAFGQQSCDFNILGTWQAPASEITKPILYRFAPDGTVTALAPAGSSQVAAIYGERGAGYEARLGAGEIGDEDEHRQEDALEGGVR